MPLAAWFAFGRRAPSSVDTAGAARARENTTTRRLAPPRDANR